MDSKQQLVDSLTSHISLYSSQTRSPNPNLNNRSSIIRWFESLSVEQRRAHLTTVDSDFVAILLQMNQRLRSDGPGRFILLPDLPQDDGSALPSLCYRKSDGLLKRSLETNANRLIRDSVQIFSSIEGECAAQSGNCGIREGEECGVAKFGRGDFMERKNINLRNSRVQENQCNISNFTGGDTLKSKRSGVLKRNNISTADETVKSNHTRNLSFDSVCMCEGLLEDVASFVKIADEMTSGEFLRSGDEAELFGQWVEMAWLKGKGYYSLEEFVVNRVEVALRLAWLSCCSGSGKKRGVKLKEKLGGVGLAVNVFWRKKGCIDWWERLDSSMKEKVFCVLLGKAARVLTLDVLDEKYQILDEEFQRNKSQDKSLRSASTSSCGQSSRIFNGSFSQIKGSAGVKHDPTKPLQCMFTSLYILQVICSMMVDAQQGGYDKEKLFFSSLDSVNTISDIILRKLREFIMVVSLDCTRLELLGERNMSSSEKKVNEKHVANNRRKKGKNKNKKPKPIPRPLDDCKSIEITKVTGDGNLISNKQDLGQSSLLVDLASKGDHAQGRMTSDAMETNNGVTNGKSRSVSRKSRKDRKKHKNSNSCTSEVASSQSGHAVVSSGSSIIIPETPSTSESPSLETESNNDVLCARKFDANPNLCSNSNAANAAQLGNQDTAETNFHGPIKSHVGKQVNCGEPEASPSLVREQGGARVLGVGDISSQSYNSYEWPNITPAYPANAHLPAATDRLHLDVGHNLQNYFHRSFLHPLHVRNSSIDSAYKGTLPRPSQVSLDWPPSVRVSRRVPSMTCCYGSEFIAMRQSSFQQNIMDQSLQSAAATSEDEQTISCELVDPPDLTSLQDLADEHGNQWMSEEKLEAHSISGMDYNQYFGGGLMYWNPSDHPGTSLSRPPSLCSDDSSWAWREADMSRTVDEMVAFSSSYSTNGLTSPSAASFCSPFDPLASGSLGYVLPGGDINGKILQSSAVADIGAEDSASGSISDMSLDIEVKSVDSLPYPVLRPIIIPNLSRERSRSDFKRGYDRKSPCVPPNRREHPRIKRPPSPVVLCVPRAPNPPPPSPVGDSRKQRGFPTVRSGSSSPRHWGVKGWFHDEGNFDEACMPVEGSEAVWASWRNKSLSTRQLTQPLAGSLIQDRLIAISHLTRDQEHPDVTFPLQPPESQNFSTSKSSVSLLHVTLHDEIDSFCKQVAAENLSRKPYISWAVKRVARSLQVLWPRSRTNIFGSNATGLSLPSSDVDLVVCLPPVRNLEPIKEAGILEGRNGIKETFLQHAARYLTNQEWVKSDSLKIVENTAIPIIMLVVEVPHDLISSSNILHMPKEEVEQAACEEGNAIQTDGSGSEGASSPKWSTIMNNNSGFKSVRIDISFKSPTHTGLQTTGLVKDLTERFPAVTPLALVLKQFLADRSLDQSYSGGLSSYCLILLITRLLQHEHHHGRPISQNYGSLLMDFLYFFGNVFDPRQMRISVQGSGVYLKRERGCSIDPLCIDDPLISTNNVGRNCFRVHQCIKAFADAYAILQHEAFCLTDNDAADVKPTSKLLPKIIPSISHWLGS